MKEDFMLILSEKHLTSLIKKTNEYTVQFGLCLTDSDIHELVLSRRECLSEQQRIEFDESILDKLIFAFCDSDYIVRTTMLRQLPDFKIYFICTKMNPWMS